MKVGVEYYDYAGVKTIDLSRRKVDIECKGAESNVPRSVYESYSAFANTKGGISFLE